TSLFTQRVELADEEALIVDADTGIQAGRVKQARLTDLCGSLIPEHRHGALLVREVGRRQIWRSMDLSDETVAASVDADDEAIAVLTVTQRVTQRRHVNREVGRVDKNI